MKTNNGRKPKSIGSTILILVVALAYLAVKPKIDQWLGQEDTNSTSVLDKEEGPSSGPINLDDLKNIKIPDAGKARPEADRTQASRVSKTPTRSSKDKTEASNVLTKVGRDYHSRAGLIYAAGGEHRRDHVLRHAKDDRSKPAHGVFDDEATVFALVDEAYEKIKKKSRDVKSTKQDRRVAYVVKMHRRIGYKGGREGNRNALNRLKLILAQGNRVITAFPY